MKKNIDRSKHNMSAITQHTGQYLHRVSTSEAEQCCNVMSNAGFIPEQLKLAWPRAGRVGDYSLSKCLLEHG